MFMSSDFVLVGRVHSAQGVRGEIFISLFAEEAAWIQKWQTLYLSPKDETKPQQEFKIVKTRSHRKQQKIGYVLKLADIDNRNFIDPLVGMNVYVPEDFFVTEDDDEKIYLREILGFKVMDQERGFVGEVIGFSGSSFQDLLIIQKNDDQESFEVPFVSPLHISTDKNKKELQMDIPYGLLPGEDI